MFSALRSGSSIYILDKNEDLQLKTGIVESVSVARPMYKTYNPAVSFGTNMQTVVDIAVKVGDQRIQFECVPSNLSLHSNGNIVISESREAMIQEIDSMLQNSKNILQSIDKHKCVVNQCENILKELNPVYAKEQERDDAISSLTEQVNGMQGVLARLEELLTKQNNGDKQVLQ